MCNHFFPLILGQDLVIILETMRIIAIALTPVAPSLCSRIYSQLGYSKDQFDAATWVSLSVSYLRVCTLANYMFYELIGGFAL